MSEKKSGHPFFGHFVSKLGVFGIFLPFSWDRFICFGQYSILIWVRPFSTLFVKTPCPQKNPVTLFLAILCPNYAFFVLFSNRINLGRADLYGSVFMLKWSTSVGLSPKFKLHCENLSIWRYRIWRRILRHPYFCKIWGFQSF